MASSSSSDRKPRIIRLPSAGMGHLAPFSRLAAALSTVHACDVSLVTFLPTVSSAESAHLYALFSAFPAVRRLDLCLPQPTKEESDIAGADPFYVHYEASRRSTPLLLPPLLAGADALVADISLASVAIPVANDLVRTPIGSDEKRIKNNE